MKEDTIMPNNQITPALSHHPKCQHLLEKRVLLLQQRDNITATDNKITRKITTFGIALLACAIPICIVAGIISWVITSFIIPALPYEVVFLIVAIIAISPLIIGIVLASKQRTELAPKMAEIKSEFEKSGQEYLEFYYASLGKDSSVPIYSLDANLDDDGGWDDGGDWGKKGGEQWVSSVG